MTPARQTKDGVILQVRVVPRSSRAAWAGRYGDTFKVHLPAPPVDGKANKALLAFLSKSFRIPVRRIELLAGHTSRTKRILLRDATLAKLALPA